MKKRILAAVLCGVLIAGLAGCGDTAEKGKEEKPVSTVTADGSADNAENGGIPADPSAPTETNHPADSVPEPLIPEGTESQSNPPVTDPASETKPPVQSEESKPAPSSPAQTEPPKQEPRPTEPPKPKPTEPAKPTDPAPPQETEKPTEPPAPEFDINQWISYAKNYAVGIGLELDSEAVECWDNPITAGADCIYIQRDIESRLNRYNRDEDITAVWIWAEQRADGDYDLYVGYA